MKTKLHWTQTEEGRRKLRIIRRKKPAPPEPEEDKLHLLYMLPGLEMAASEVLQRIDSIRRTLGQGPWNFKPQEVSNSNSSHRNSNPSPPVQEKKKKRISRVGKKNIQLAQKKRWQNYHKEQEPEPEPQEKKKKPLSKAQLRAMKANALKARAALKAKHTQANRQAKGKGVNQ
jgi:hypothetical protein